MKEVPGLVTRRNVLALAVFVISLFQPDFKTAAQTPDSLSGRTVELTVTSGSGWFAKTGKYRFLPSATDNFYATVPIWGPIAPSAGTYTYTKTGTTTARLQLKESDGESFTVNCTFTKTNSGSYNLESGLGTQSGTFVIFSGPSPTSIAGTRVTVEITSGEYPFAEKGSFHFLPAADNTYHIVPISGDVVPSSGTYTYEKNSAFTGIVRFNDSQVGSGQTLQLSFDSQNAGTVFLHKSGTRAYQTGLFVIEWLDTIGPSLAITSHADGQKVNTATITLKGTATDSGRGNSGVKWVTVNGQRASNDTATGSGTASWSKTISLSPGPNSITVVACDNSPNQNTTTVNLTITYVSGDTTAPVLSVTSHTSGQTVTTNAVVLRGTATDSGRGNSGIKMITVNGERASNDTATGSATANWNKTVNLIPGSNTITVIAYDNSPNSNAATVTLTLNYIPPDTSGPSLAITSHDDGQVVDTPQIELTGTATDAGCGNNGVLSVTVNGELANNGTAAGSNTAHWSFTLRLNPGRNTITVVAQDNSPARNTTTLQVVLIYVPAALASGTTDLVYIEDAIPESASNGSQGSWTWIDRDPAPISGRFALQVKPSSGLRSRWFAGATKPMHVNPGDTLIAYAYINPTAKPRMIMLQWREGASWEHRAYWGEDLFPTEWTKLEPTSKVRIGNLPQPGQWVRLEIPARLVGLEGKDVNGVSVNVHDGEVAWDHIGKAVPARDQVWIGDDVPEAATTDAFWADAWIWTNANPTPYFGTRSHVSSASADLRTHFVSVPSPGWAVNPQDALFSYVFLDPVSPPKMIMLQWWDGSWEHRAYWGEDKFPNSWTKGERTSKVFMGPLPQPGQWVRLSVPAGCVGLENRSITGVAFSVFDGKAYWDNTGKAVPSVDFVWVGDALPRGATGQSYTGEKWSWSESNPTPFSGAKAHVSPPADGLRGHFFVNAQDALQVDRGDVLIAYIYLNPANMPRMIMLQWNDGSSSNPWGHRAYWGENLFPYGSDGPPERCYMGPLPPPGNWVRLEVPAKLVGLEGKLVRGMSFDRYGGEVVWDHAGKSSAMLAEDTVWLADKLPAGARSEVFNEPAWTWASGSPTPLIGEFTHKSLLSAQTQAPKQYHHHLFIGNAGQKVNAWDRLYAYVYLDPSNPPQMVMLQWNDGVWAHRAYWGANLFPWGKDAPPERCYVGSLPPLGQWVRLELPASLVGLENRSVYGMAFSLYGGQAWWCHAGKRSAGPHPNVPQDDWVWVDDDLPLGATKMVSGPDDWIWTGEDPGPISGTLLHKSKWVPARTVRSHYFAFYTTQSTQPMTVNAGDELFCYVYLDPYALPQMIMLQWRAGTSWEHRAYWGENLFTYGANDPTSKVYMGMLPPAGKWVRLRIPAKTVGLEGKTVTGMAFTAAGGQVWWDRAGKRAGQRNAGLLAHLEVDGFRNSGERFGISAGPELTQAGYAPRCRIAGNAFGGAISGLPIGMYRIEASTNLMDWVDIGTGWTLNSGVLEFIDEEAWRHEMRFYRAVPVQK